MCQRQSTPPRTRQTWLHAAPLRARERFELLSPAEQDAETDRAVALVARMKRRQGLVDGTDEELAGIRELLSMELSGPGGFTDHLSCDGRDNFEEFEIARATLNRWAEVYAAHERGEVLVEGFVAESVRELLAEETDIYMDGDTRPRDVEALLARLEREGVGPLVPR